MQCIRTWKIKLLGRLWAALPEQTRKALATNSSLVCCTIICFTAFTFC